MAENGQINVVPGDVESVRSDGREEVASPSTGASSSEERDLMEGSPDQGHPVDKEPEQKYTTRQIVTLCTLVALNISSAMFYSLLAPFFPLEAKFKGANSAEIGFILGAFQLVVLVMSPTFGYLMTHIGAKFMVVTGNFVCSACAIMFGMLQWSPPGRMFVGLCIATRTVEAIGAAAQSTASFAIAAHTFRHKVSTVMGILQAGSCIGLLAGPPIGGTLYAYGGYHMPFLVTGSIFMVFTLFCAFTLPSASEEDNRRGPLSLKLKLVRTPIVIIIGYVVFLGQAAIGFIDISLSPRIKELQPNISTIYIGLIFLIPSAIVVVLSPIYGIITDKFQGLGQPIILFGVIFSIGTFLCLGPSPLLKSLFPNPSLRDVIIILSVSGVGWGSLIVTYQQFVLAARRLGLPDTMETQGVISGINGAFNSFGAFFGPTIGGILLQHVGFGWSCTAISGMAVLGGIFLLTHMVLKATCCPDIQLPPENDSESKNDSERTPLLNENQNGRGNQHGQIIEQTSSISSA